MVIVAETALVPPASGVIVRAAGLPAGLMRLRTSAGELVVINVSPTISIRNLRTPYGRLQNR